MKVPQEGCLFHQPCSEKGEGEAIELLPTSSDSKSCSDVESPSEEVAIQLANLKERVCIIHLLHKCPVFLDFLAVSLFQLKVVSHQLSRLTQVPSKKQKKNRLKREKISKEKDVKSKHKLSKCKIVVKKVVKTKNPTL